MQARVDLLLPCLVPLLLPGELLGQAADRCPTTTCFDPERVRNYEIIDSDTLLVYTGTQSCPLRLDFTGISCDLTLLPGSELVFREDTVRTRPDADETVTRICARDTDMGIADDIFSGGVDAQGLENARLSCRIRDVASVTDDEIVEIYFEHGIAPPPPPLGAGEIEVPAEEGGTPGEGETGNDDDSGAAPRDP